MNTVYFPAKPDLKIDTFLTLMGKNLIPDSHFWLMDSFRNVLNLTLQVSSPKWLCKVKTKPKTSFLTEGRKEAPLGDVQT